MPRNDRETGARKYPPAKPAEPITDQNAGMPAPPKPFGLTRPVDDADRKADRSEKGDPKEPPRRAGTKK